MVFFRRSKVRQVTSQPLPDWDDTRWRSHLRATALGVEHHCNLYVERINNERKDAATAFKEKDEPRARLHAESAFRNKRIITALGALVPISSALHERAERLAGCTSIAAIPDPTRSNIVTIIYSATRLHMSYLTGAVDFLREQFGTTQIDQIQKGLGDLYPLVNPTVRDSLSNITPSDDDTSAELASAVKEYLTIPLDSSVPQTPGSEPNPIAAPQLSPLSSMRLQPPPPIPGSATLPQSTPGSTKTSEAGPLSPELEEPRILPMHENVLKTPSPPRSMRNQKESSSGLLQRFEDKDLLSPSSPVQTFRASIVAPASMAAEPKTPVKYSKHVEVQGSQPALKMKMFQESEVSEPFAVADSSRSIENPLSLSRAAMPEQNAIPEHLKSFRDSDEMLLERYAQLKMVLQLV